MEKELHETVEAAHVEQAIGTENSSPEKEKENKSSGIFRFLHHSKDEKEEKEKKELSKREKVAIAVTGLGATLKIVKLHGGSGKEEKEGGAEEEVKEEGKAEEGDGGGDGEEEGGFSAFITMIAEAFEE